MAMVRCTKCEELVAPEDIGEDGQCEECQSEVPDHEEIIDTGVQWADMVGDYPTYEDAENFQGREAAAGAYALRHYRDECVRLEGLLSNARHKITEARSDNKSCIQHTNGWNQALNFVKELLWPEEASS